jgi:hypothetical protein
MVAHALKPCALLRERVKILIQLGINLAVVAVFYFFGASLTTCWFTFLIFCGFAVLGELGDRLYEIECKLDAQAKSDTLARIEGKLDAIPNGE